MARDRGHSAVIALISLLFVASCATGFDDSVAGSGSIPAMNASGSPESPQESLDPANRSATGSVAVPDSGLPAASPQEFTPLLYAPIADGGRFLVNRPASMPLPDSGFAAPEPPGTPDFQLVSDPVFVSLPTPPDEGFRHSTRESSAVRGQNETHTEVTLAPGQAGVNNPNVPRAPLEDSAISAEFLSSAEGQDRDVAADPQAVTEEPGAESNAPDLEGANGQPVVAEPADASQPDFQLYAEDVASTQQSTPEAERAGLRNAVAELPSQYREVVLGPRQNLVLALPGVGWIYTGAREANPAGDRANAGVELVDKRNLEATTEFVFRLPGPGSFTLEFQRQDLVAGRFETLDIELDAESPDEASAGMANQELLLEFQLGSATSPQGIVTAEESLEAGTRLAQQEGEGDEDAGEGDSQESASPASIHGTEQAQPGEATTQGSAQNSVSDTDSVVERLSTAETMMNSGELEQAADLYRDIEPSAIEHPEHAVHWASAELQLGDEEVARELYASLLPVVGRQGLLDQAMALADIDRIDDAITLVEWLTELTRAGLDELYYRLAGLYERESERRDLRRSRDLYELVVQQHPLSRFRQPSRERASYLNRHFFHIR